MLIAHRASLNTKANHGLSALMLAIVAGHEGVTLLLACRRANHWRIVQRACRAIWAARCGSANCR